MLVEAALWPEGSSDFRSIRGSRPWGTGRGGRGRRGGGRPGVRVWGDWGRDRCHRGVAAITGFVVKSRHVSDASSRRFRLPVHPVMEHVLLVGHGNTTWMPFKSFCVLQIVLFVETRTESLRFCQVLQELLGGLTGVMGSPDLSRPQRHAAFIGRPLLLHGTYCTMCFDVCCNAVICGQELVIWVFVERSELFQILQKPLDTFKPWTRAGHLGFCLTNRTVPNPSETARHLETGN